MHFRFMDQCLRYWIPLSWVFLSYHRDFPPLILTIERDEEIMSKIADAVDKFHAELDAAKEKIQSYDNR